jgi:alanyl-tRNA synthetase
MSKRLYLSDSYTTEFESRIVERRETPDGPAVILEETYFYPESGGQPHDHGTIGGIPIKKVTESGEEVLHILSEWPESDRVSCSIDRGRRNDHMQQHNGQHILSAAFLREAEAQTLSFHLGSVSSTIDLDRGAIDPELISRVEQKANAVVRSARPVRSYLVKSEEASRLKLRKAPQVEGTIRIVDVEGFDRQPCCGTHPRNTAEVGPISIRGTERFKGGTRVEFVCGDRALRAYRECVDTIRSLSSVLNSPEHELVQTATDLIAGKKGLAKTVQTLREELLQHRASRWLSEAETRAGFKLVAREATDVTPAELRLLAIFITKEPSRVALLGARAEGRAHLVFARSADAAQIDMGGLLLESLPSVGGKGGGSPHIAQGGGPRLEGLDGALAKARESILRTVISEQ